MPASEKCSQCLHGFSMVKLPRKLPCCPHSICEGCLRDIIDARQDVIICGFCASHVKKQDIRIFPLNTVLLLTLSEPPPTPSRQQPLPPEDNQLLADLPVVATSSEGPAEQLCPAHKVVMDIICISDKQRICPHCALFGNHRDHRFKRLEDFQKEVGEKRKVFQEISNEKQQLFKVDHYRIYEQLARKIELKKAQLLEEIEAEAKRHVDELLKAKQKAFQAVEAACMEFQQGFASMPAVARFQKSKGKFQKWEKTCLQALDFIDTSPNVEEKLYFYYEGPLEIVSEGFIFIEELNKYGQQISRKLTEQLAEIHFSKEAAPWLDKCFRLTKPVSPNSTHEEDSDINPFMDCTSSEIVLGQNSLLNNTSLQAEISTISRQIKGEASRTTTPRKQPTLKAVKSVEKERPRISINPQQKSNTSTFKALPMRRPTSEIVTYKFSPRMTKSPTTKEIPSETEVKPFQMKEPQKIYLQFSKNTLSDFFDLSDCSLPSDKVVEYVHRARRIHKIKGLKLCNNRLNLAGFQRMTEFMQGVSNVNLANNNINEGVFEVILRNKDRLESLRLINLSHNPITLDKKAAARMEQVKKSGIIIVL